MPYLSTMTKLSEYSMSGYDRWAEEVEAMLSLAGLAAVIKGGATPEDENKARAVLILSMERDVRDAMGKKLKEAKTATEVWKVVNNYQNDGMDAFQSVINTMLTLSPVSSRSCQEGRKNG